MKKWTTLLLILLLAVGAGAVDYRNQFTRGERYAGPLFAERFVLSESEGTNSFAWTNSFQESWTLVRLDVGLFSRRYWSASGVGETPDIGTLYFEQSGATNGYPIYVDITGTYAGWYDATEANWYLTLSGDVGTTDTNCFIQVPASFTATGTSTQDCYVAATNASLWGGLDVSLSLTNLTPDIQAYQFYPTGGTTNGANIYVSENSEFYIWYTNAGLGMGGGLPGWICSTNVNDTQTCFAASSPETTLSALAFQGEAGYGNNATGSFYLAVLEAGTPWPFAFTSMTFAAGTGTTNGMPIYTNETYAAYSDIATSNWYVTAIANIGDTSKNSFVTSDLFFPSTNYVEQGDWIGRLSIAMGTNQANFTGVDYHSFYAHTDDEWTGTVSVTYPTYYQDTATGTLTLVESYDVTIPEYRGYWTETNPVMTNIVYTNYSVEVTNTFTSTVTRAWLSYEWTTATNQIVFESTNFLYKQAMPGSVFTFTSPAFTNGAHATIIGKD